MLLVRNIFEDILTTHAAYTEVQFGGFTHKVDYCPKMKEKKIETKVKNSGNLD